MAAQASEPPPSTSYKPSCRVVDPSHRLPSAQVWSYGLPALSLTAVGVPLLLFLVPFYTTDMGLHPEVVGLTLLLVRVADGIFDPTLGMLSDRIRTPWGRRRPWLLAGTILLVIAVYFVFLPTPPVTPGYFLVWSIVLYASWTMVIVPYAAWGAELTKDFTERTRVAGVRELFLLIGTVLSASVPTIAKWLGDESYGATMEAIGIFVIVGLPVAVAIMFRVVPEKQPEILNTHHDWREGLRTIRRNGPFLRLISAFMLNSLSQNLTATLFYFFVDYVLDARSVAPYLLLAYFLSGIAAVPMWIKLAERFGKHRTWAVSMIFSAAVFLVAPFLGPDDLWIFWIVVLLSGPSLGCDQILASSMQADVVDIDTLRTGQQRAGLYFALWNMVTKLAGGLSAGFALPVLGLVGFTTAGVNPPLAIAVLIVLYGVVPPLLRLTSVFIIWNYPITKPRHERIRQMIERKKRRLDAAGKSGPAA